jgi:hypothetical protein
MARVYDSALNFFQRGTAAMQPLRQATLLGSLTLLLTGGTLGAQAAPQDTRNALAYGAAAPSAPGRDQFAGSWAYNELESVNAANGRSEGSAGGAVRRGGLPGGGRGGPVMGGGAFAPSGQGGFGNGTGSPFTSLISNERRDLQRDLLEIPVELTIRMDDAAVTFIDHLDRERTYPTTGRKQKYQLSASEFHAKTYWEGAQLRRDIEGTEGFRLRETYFVSGDGKRLFVILRLGDPSDKAAPVAGVNRVYDRIDRASAK